MAKSKKIEKRSFEGMSATEIFDVFGGEQSRGGVSRTMRGLAAEGYSTGAIAKMLGKRYQHVRNVLTQPLKKSDAAEVETIEGDGEE